MKNKQKALIGFALLSLIALSCQPKTKEKQSAEMETKKEMAYSLPDPKNFDKTHQGKKIELFILKNGPIQAAITNYGARMVGLLVPRQRWPGY